MTPNMRLTCPSVEQHPSGFGIGTPIPRLSWRFLPTAASPSNWEQTAYEVEICRPPDSKSEVFRVISNDSVLIPWPGKPLDSREQASVRVRVFGRASPSSADVSSQTSEADLGEPSDWSPPLRVECGLLGRGDWTANFITASDPALTSADGPLRPIRFRKTFNLSMGSSIDQARLYITSLGVYSAFINGKRVGDHFMAPGWTSYCHRLHYQIFDVTELLDPSSANVIAVEVAEGWYAGRLAWEGRRRIFGEKLGVLAQLEVKSSTSEVFQMLSDSSWHCAPSAIIRSEIYNGELYDVRQEQPGWEGSRPTASFDDRCWSAARDLPFPKANLLSSDKPPARVIEERNPANIILTPSGKTILDFGQNLVGRLRVPYVQKPAGNRVIFTHAEVLENGELGTRPLRSAKCIDEVVMAESPLENWCPQFTFHGFRYVQVDGWSADDPECPLSLSSVVAQVLHTDLVRSGWFSCSHPMVNQLHDNALWSMRGNFLSVPTDCPQRDERLGWTGDIQVFCPSASFLYNTAGMLSDWLADVAAEQLEEGREGIPPVVVPDVLQDLWPTTPQAVWDDVTVLTPWALYQAYGDINILRAQYPSMLAWLDQGIRRGQDGLWDPHIWQLGDWLDPIAPPDEPGNARTDRNLVADAYLVHVTFVMAQVSKCLGESDDADRFTAQASSAKVAFQQKYIAPSGLVVGDSQTALSLAIVFGLHATPEQIAEAGARLAYLIRREKFRVATGFAGTPVVTHALSSTGHWQDAYRMLLEKKSPSWMYPVTMGATTTWERWDSMLPDGTINPGEMTSFNHYALGSIINWLHSCVAGISPLEPGWKNIKVMPMPGGTINSAEAVYETPYGRLECRWKVDNRDDFTLELLVPANTKAWVVLPAHGHTATNVKADDGAWVGSGRHTFSSKFDYQLGWPPKPLVPPIRGQELDTFV